MSKPTVWIRSHSKQNLGLFLIFLSLMLLIPVPALLAAAEIENPRSLVWASLPAVLAATGFSLRSLPRKRFWAGPGHVKVHDGFDLHSRSFEWQGPADVALSSYEDRQGEWWVVELACGKPHYPLHKCLGEPAQARHLATSLARAIGGSLVENETTVITRAELDLPLEQRLRLHPQLLGEELQRPEPCRVVLQEGPEGLVFRWKHPLIQVLPFFFTLVVLIVMLASAPLFPGEVPENYSEWRGSKFQRSAWEQLQRRDDSFFRLSGLFLALATLTWAGVRQELHFSRGRATHKTQLWGIPLAWSSLPASEIREIWARPLQHGCDFEVVGESRQLGGWMAQPAAARWIVSRALRFYARV